MLPLSAVGVHRGTILLESNPILLCALIVNSFNRDLMKHFFSSFFYVDLLACSLISAGLPPNGTPLQVTKLHVINN